MSRPASSRRRLDLAAMAVAMLLVTGTSIPPPVRAADTTLQIATRDKGPTAVGGTYTVIVTQDAAGPVSGAQVSITFDPLALQVRSVTLGAAYARAPIFVGASAEEVEAANSSGRLGPVAAAFVPPEAVSAGSADFLVVTFRVVGCGGSHLGLSGGPTGAVLLDGRAASYGTPLEVAASPADVAIRCAPGESPVPAPVASSGAGAGASGSALTAGSCPIWLQTRASSTVGEILDVAEPGFVSAWAPQTAMLVGERTTTQALSELTSGTAQVAAIDRPLFPDEVAGLLAWEIGTDATGHPVFVAVRKPGVANRIDDSTLVRGDDLVNYLLSAPGQAAVAQAGYQAAGVPAAPPILDYDVNLDGGVSVLDLGAITARWGHPPSSCRGWIRADVNNDGGISVLDLGQVTGHWGQAGFVAPSPPAPWADAITAHYDQPEDPHGLDTRQAGINMAVELGAAGYRALNTYGITANTALGPGFAFADAVWAMFGHGGLGGMSTDDPIHEWTWVHADGSFGSCTDPNVCLTTAGWANLHRIRLMLFAGCDTADARPDGVGLLSVAHDAVGVDAAVGFAEHITWPPGDYWSQRFFHYLGPDQWDVGDAAWGASWDAWLEYGDSGGWDSFVILGDDVWVMPPQYGQ